MPMCRRAVNKLMECILCDRSDGADNIQGIPVIRLYRRPKDPVSTFMLHVIHEDSIILLNC